MSLLKVVNINRGESYDVNIGPLNQTFKNYRLLWTEPGRVDGHAEAPTEFVQDYELFLLQNPAIIKAAKDLLTGKILGCYCAPAGGLGPDDRDQHGKFICHGQILLKAIRGDYG